MKKLKFNCPLDHKPHSFDPMQIEVEKVVTLYGKRFEQMKDHPLEDCYELAELAHAGDRTFYFDDVLGNTNLKAMMIQAVAEMLGDRCDLAQVKDCYLDIPCQLA